MTTCKTQTPEEDALRNFKISTRCQDCFTAFTKTDSQQVANSSMIKVVISLALIIGRGDEAALR